MIPIIIIAYNQLTYIRNMVYQCLPLTDKIYIIDNNSCYKPLIDYYINEIPKFKNVELIKNSNNTGHNVWNGYINLFPEEFVVTDPDLFFNPEMPKNTVSILSNIRKKFDSAAVGLALDISDHNNFSDIKYGGKSIYDHESQFWKDKVQESSEEIYHAGIDTTFALRTKVSSTGGYLRVAGKFTCKHIPWYRIETSPLPISIEENTAYLQGNISTNWFIKLDFQYDITTREHKDIKIDSSNKDSDWFNFMKNSYRDGWEKETFDIIDKFIDNSKVFIDIGSWVGPISLYYADKFQNIYSIEADREAVRILRLNIALNNFNNIIVIDKAIYNENKIIFFGANEFLPIKETNKSISQARESKLYENDYKVEAITFGEIIKRYQIDKIGLIKCDIEGGEENIIEDLLRYSHDNHIPVIISFHIAWWKNHTLEDFGKIFSLFNGEILNDLKKDSFKTVLFMGKI